MTLPGAAARVAAVRRAQRPSKAFQFVSVAVDTQGADAARPWTERAGATFPTVVDRDNALAAIYDYKLIPNGVVLDAAGIIRYRKIGGFSVEHAADVEAIQRLIDGAVEQVELEAPAVPYQLDETERALVDTRMRLGAGLFARGARAEAVAEWRRALQLDPGNLTIRKQIWMAEHPGEVPPDDRCRLAEGGNSRASATRRLPRASAARTAAPCPVGPDGRPIAPAAASRRARRRALPPSVGDKWFVV